MPKIYDNYTHLQVWSVLEDTINNLVENQDLTLTTDPYYVIGSILKSLDDHNLIIR